MKNPKIYFLLLLCLNVNNVFAQYTWTQKANYGGGGRYAAAAFTIGNKCYMGAGVTHVGYTLTYYSDVWEWDQSTNVWTQKADFPGTQRYGTIGFSIGSKGYITLGWSTGPALNDLWEFDASLNAWTQKTNFGGSARYDAAGFVIGNYAYIGTGYAPYSSDFWKYDASSDSWTQIADVGGGGRSAAVGFAIDSFGYVACGGTEFAYYSTDLWRYDPSSNSWAQKSAFPGQGRVAPAAFVLGGKGYVGAGCTDVSVFNDFYSYDPSTDTWAIIDSFPGAGRIWARGFSIGAYGYVGTGSDQIHPDGVDQADFWQYGPVSTPAASFQSSDRIFCAYSCVNYTNQSTNSTSWQWQFQGATPDTSTAQNPQNICYFNAGSFGVTLIASDSSSSDTLSYNNYITIFPSPVAPSIYRRGDTLYCTTQPTYTYYQWFYNDSIIAGANDTFLVATQTGNYNAEVRDENGCSIAVGINVILGVSEIDANSYFTLYPNPVSEELNISMLSAFHDADIEVTDVLGRKLFQQTFDSAKDNNLSIDFRSFAAGIYFVSVTSDGERITKKAIKESIVK